MAHDKLDEWIYFLKNEEIREEFSAKGLKEAKEKLDVLKLSEKERLAYEQYAEDLHYQASMFESSYVVGRDEGKKEMILQACRAGMSIKEIAGMFELELSKVEDIVARANE